MSQVPLSVRLETLVDAVVEGGPVWDIGCDHGLVGLSALASGRASAAVLVDKSAAVTARLQKTLAQHLAPAHQARVRVITADGARLPAEPVEGTVVLAGMGARAMMRILSTFVLPNAAGPLRLVLQPEVEEERLQAWLQSVGLPPVQLQRIEERGRQHVVVVVNKP